MMLLLCHQCRCLLIFIRIEKSGLLVDAICVLLLLCLQLRLSFVRIVFDFNVSLNDTAPASPMIFPIIRLKCKKSALLMPFVLFLRSSRSRLSFVSVVFDFNASLNDVAPFSPIPFPVDLMRIEKGGLLMNVICVLFLLSSPWRLSSMSVVFDFNASLNDVAPVYPILLSVDDIQREFAKPLCFLIVYNGM